MKAKTEKQTYSIYILIAIGAIMVLLFVGLAIRSWRNSGQRLLNTIHNDIALLEKKFLQIHQDCEITHFDQPKININFLNVAKFTGNQIGDMHLKKPQNWKGPYLVRNPEIQGKEYQIISATDGYYIVPGDGITLPNGKIVGKDITFSSGRMSKIIKDTNGLLIDNKSLGVKLPFISPQNNTLSFDQLRDI